MRTFSVFTNPITGAHVTGEPDGPPLAKFKPADKDKADELAENLTAAVRLAHSDRDGHPRFPLQNPPPTIAEARAILSDSLRRCTHTWLTGEKALETLNSVKL